MHVLIVQPDRNVAEALDLQLKASYFHVTHADTGWEKTGDPASLHAYNVILMNTKMPDIPGQRGLKILETLRRKGVQTPIIVLSEEDDISSKVTALGFGADDYMTIPYDKDELVARIHAVMRRSQGRADNVVMFGPFALNTEKQHVSAFGETLHLMPRQFQLLAFLAENKGALVTRQQILDALYPSQEQPQEKVIDVVISNIRRQLEPHDKRNFIMSVHGKGYRLVDDPDSYVQRVTKKPAPLNPS